MDAVYPSYRHHVSKPSKIVTTPEEDEAATAEGYRMESYSADEMAVAAALPPTTLPPHASGSPAEGVSAPQPRRH